MFFFSFPDQQGQDIVTADSFVASRYPLQADTKTVPVFDDGQFSHQHVETESESISLRVYPEEDINMTVNNFILKLSERVWGCPQCRMLVTHEFWKWTVLPSQIIWYLHFSRIENNRHFRHNSKLTYFHILTDKGGWKPIYLPKNLILFHLIVVSAPYMYDQYYPFKSRSPRFRGWRNLAFSYAAKGF